MRTETRWKELLAWLGYKPIVKKVRGRWQVRLNRNPGIVSFGESESLTDALAIAAYGQHIDWDSVDRKLTEHDWAQMARQ